MPHPPLSSSVNTVFQMPLSQALAFAGKFDVQFGFKHADWCPRQDGGRECRCAPRLYLCSRTWLIAEVRE